MRIHEITTADEFAEITADWDDLLEKSGQSDWFLTSSWITVVLEQQLTSYDRLAIITCREDGVLVGAIPAYVSPPSGHLGARRLHLLSSDTIAPHRTGALIAPAAPPETIGLLADRLLAWTDWDAIELSRLHPDSPLLGAVEAHADVCRRCVRPNHAELSVVDLPASWEELLGMLSKSMRATVRRAWRKIESEYKVDIEAVTDPALLPEAARDATAMFASRMSHRYRQEFIPSDRHERFLEAICWRCMEAGALRLYFLRVDGRRVSYVIDIAHGDTVFAYKTGFFTEWAPYRIGTLIYAHGLRTAVEDGFSRYDFGPGRMEHKARFGAGETRPLAGLRLHAPTLIGRTSSIGERAAQGVRGAAKRLVPATTRTRLTLEREWRELNQKWG